MIINDNIPRIYVGNIKDGMAFRHGGKVYIKTEQINGMYRHECIELATGKQKFFETDTLVELLEKATVEINYE